MPIIGELGDHVDAVIRHGADFGPHLVILSNPDGTPVDLTGAIVTGRVFTRPAVVPCVSVDFVTRIVDVVNGQFEFWLPPELSSMLPPGRDMRDKNGSHEWALEVTFNDGFVQPIFWGDAQVKSSGARC